MQGQFTEVNHKLDEKASQSTLDSLANSIDQFIKRLDDQETNQLVRDRQFKKLLEWTPKVSATTGIPIENL